MIFYLAAIFAFVLSSWGLHKAYSGDLGQRPAPGLPELLCSIFGGPLSGLGTVALVGAGFLTYSWWVPVASLLGSFFLAGVVQGALPIAATYAIIGFPIGLAMGVGWLVVG